MAKKSNVTAVRFLGETKHGGHRFLEGAVIGFTNENVANYMVRCGWAEPSKEEPHLVFQDDEISADPNTFHLLTGRRVKDLKPSEAAKALKLERGRAELRADSTHSGSEG